MKDLIKKEMQYNHPIAVIWNAISKEDEISAWLESADLIPVDGITQTCSTEPRRFSQVSLA